MLLLILRLISIYILYVDNIKNAGISEALYESYEDMKRYFMLNYQNNKIQTIYPTIL